MGDLNARTSTKLDFIPNDNDDHLPLHSDYSVDSLLRQRHSQDQALDDRGKHVLEICIGAQLRILNGRKLGDTAGYFTSHQYNGSSVIDYAICSHNLLNAIPYFKVHKFQGLISDHCMISFMLQCNKPETTDDNITLHDLPPTFKWDTESKEGYLKVLASPYIKSQLSELNLAISTATTPESINDLTDKLKSILYESAKLSLKLKQNKPKKKNNPKPWSTPTVKRMERDLLKKARNMTQLQTGESRKAYFLALKLFKRERKYALRHFRNAQYSKLYDLQYNNPRQFWKILEDLNKTPTQEISDYITREMV